jgi:hypothetical protein
LVYVTIVYEPGSAELVQHCNARTDYELISHRYAPDACAECARIAATCREPTLARIYVSVGRDGDVALGCTLCADPWFVDLDYDELDLPNLNQLSERHLRERHHAVIDGGVVGHPFQPGAVSDLCQAPDPYRLGDRCYLPAGNHIHMR